MKKNHFQVGSLLVLALLTGCEKETKVIETRIIEKVSDNLVVPEVKDEAEGKISISNENGSTVTFEAIRKTTLETDSDGNIINIESFTKDLNKWKIVATNNGRALDRGELKCLDLTDPTKFTEEKSNFNLDGTKAELNISLANSLTKLKEHKYRCSVFENKILLDKSTSGEIVFYKDIFVTSNETNINEIGFTSGNTTNKVGALIIDSTARIVTNGQNLKIRADQVIALSGSSIKTFENNRIRSADNIDGSHGGLIEIKTKFILGELNVEMRGLNAGIRTTSPLKETQYPSEYKEGMLDGPIPTYDMNSNPSGSLPLSGKDGQKGRKGKIGLTGLNGGDSGIFKLITNQSSDLFKINVKLIAGKGSEGGPGGLGGPGVPGGKKSPHNPQVFNSNNTDGTDGPEGDVGEQGLPGRSGQIQYGQYINLLDHTQNIDFHAYSNLEN